MGQIWDFFSDQISVQYEIEKIPDLSYLGPILTHFGAKPTIPAFILHRRPYCTLVLAPTGNLGENLRIDLCHLVLSLLYFSFRLVCGFTMFDK